LLFNLTPALLIANLIALGIGMTIHEFAHNYVGYRMGDPTPKRMGRLTLNPLVHINWIGWIMFAVLGFGILGSAPINPYNMPAENRRWRWFAAVAAGPISNLILAILFGIVMRLLFAFNIYDLGDLFLAYQADFDVARLPILIIYQVIALNVVLFLFNLIPLFPIDGWHMVFCLLPPSLAAQWERYQQVTFYIFIGLMLLSFTRIFNVFGILISQPAGELQRLLIGI